MFQGRSAGIAAIRRFFAGVRNGGNILFFEKNSLIWRLGGIVFSMFC
jgi:hypothetical protein